MSSGVSRAETLEKSSARAAAIDEKRMVFRCTEERKSGGCAELFRIYLQRLQSVHKVAAAVPAALACGALLAPNIDSM